MNDDAFSRALTDIAPSLSRYFRRRVADGATADDLTQDTLIKAYRAGPTLRDHKFLLPWVHRIARHTLVDYFRRKVPVSPLCESLAQEESRQSDTVRAVLVCSARCYLRSLP